MAQALKDRFGEVLIAEGVDRAGGGTIRFYTTPSGHTWTMAYERAGAVCIGPYGRNWEWSDDVEVVFGAPA